MVGEGKSYVTGVTAPLPLPSVVELGTSRGDVLMRDMLVDSSGIGVVEGNCNGVTITLPGGGGNGDDDDATTDSGDTVGPTTGLILTVVEVEIRRPPGSVVDAPPLTEIASIPPKQI